jgi:hypothetical protein
MVFGIGQPRPVSSIFGMGWVHLSCQNTNKLAEYLSEFLPIGSK